VYFYFACKPVKCQYITFSTRNMESEKKSCFLFINIRNSLQCFKHSFYFLTPPYEKNCKQNFYQVRGDQLNCINGISVTVLYSDFQEGFILLFCCFLIMDIIEGLFVHFRFSSDTREETGTTNIFLFKIYPYTRGKRYF
jgi:hypothetical protein